MRVKVNAETAREVLYAGGVVWHDGGSLSGMSMWTWAKRGGLCQQYNDDDIAVGSEDDTLDDVLTWTDCEIEVPDDRIVPSRTRTNASTGANQAAPRRSGRKRRKV